ncbi:MAG: biotin/lipoyl-binding protein [Planctomycetota bacterium]
MTLQLRPTFSESWYRVKDLKPRLRAAAQISRQFYRGERWYIVRDPAGNQYHRLSDVAYQFIGLLDGTRTVGEAWELVGGQLADDAPTQPEVIQILSQLYSANLIETNIAPDAQVLLRRQKKQRERKFQGRLMNLLFPRIPLWDPDKFLKIWMPLAGPLISRGGMILWLLVVGAALFLVLPESDKFAAQTQDFLRSGTVEMWLLLGVTFLGTKFLHEMGHAFAVRRFGGECHEVGIMFLVLMPCPYVDASTAWGFPSKWKRIFVGAGGMIAEVFIAALAAIVWYITLNNPNSAVNQIAYYTMLIASISTLLFNANPLLRYDGYYILSDWLEIPNLQQKSREYSLGLIKRYILRVKTTQPLPQTIRQKLWLAFYWSASGLYRIFIGFAILYMVIYSLPEQVRIVGYFLAAGAIATFFVVPIFKLFKYLTTEPELHRKRTRAWLFTGTVTAVLVFFVGILPIPSAVRADAISEPLDRAEATIMSAGTLVKLEVRDGDLVEEGQPLATLENKELETELRVAELEVERLRTLRDGVRFNDRAFLGSLNEQIAGAKTRVEGLKKRLDDLVVRAPIAGVFMAPRIEDRLDTYLQQGDPLGIVQDAQQLEFFVSVDQASYQRVFDAMKRDAATVQVRLASDLDNPIEGGEIDADVRMLPSAKNELRSNALTFAGGGTIAPDPSDPNKSSESLFEIRLVLPNAGEGDRPRYLPGQRAYVRIKLEDEPIMTQALRAARQLIQTQTTATAAQQG